MQKFKFKKAYGQNFLVDKNFVKRIIKEADISRDTLVIEIGPGDGALSREIVPLAGFSIMYEIDKELKDRLEFALRGYDNYQIIFNDFLLEDVNRDIDCFDFDKVKVVANLPYYITSPIIGKIIDVNKIDEAIIMVQKEVADRLSSLPGNSNYGYISVLIGACFSIKKLFNVDKSCFYPMPNVDSAVISLVRHNKYVINDFNFYKKFVGDAFKFKRKTLRNNLRGYDLTVIGDVLNKYGHSIQNRAEEISVLEFVEVVNILNSK